MSCTTCGSNLPCGCSSPVCGSLAPTPYTNCATGCNDSAAIGSRCSNIVQATPLPYYSCAPSCPEDHTQKIVINKFAADVKITSSWNVPACGEFTIVTIPGLTQITIGSYLWNPSLGYFEVTAFNSGTQQVTLLNRCTDGNAAAGTAAPSCSEFVITDPPVDTTQQSGACVAVDFTAPPICPVVGCCIDITLTTVNGLTSGGIVQIGTGFYTVDAVKPNDIITICNNGDGILPGTAVIAQDASGNYNYCLTILSSNPCKLGAVISGTVLACSQNVAHPLTGDAVGYSLTLVDPSGFAEYRPGAGAPDCTRLAATLDIIAATAGYTLSVGEVVGLSIGDVLQIGSRTDRLTVTSFPTPTQISGTLSPVPALNVAIPVGTLVCQIGCCESLEAVTPKLLVRDGRVLTVDGSAFEQDIGSFTLKAGTIDANGYVRILLETTARTIAIATSVVYKLKINGSVIITTGAIVIPDDATPAPTECPIPIELNIMNAGALTAQKCTLSLMLGVPALPGIANTTRDTYLGFATTAINTTTTDLTIQLTVQWSWASVNNVVTRNMYFAEVF